ncbi:MAG TPA: DUF6249 domain-containing protein [Caulobacteraceae bacterium]|jgi:Na+/H+ antiporter NhaD/arsenite permease-like protein
MDEIWIPISFFAMIVAVVALPVYFRSKERAKLHDTLRVAYERGQPVDPAIIAAIQQGERARPSAERDLRVGIILIAVALAMITMGLVTNDISDGHSLAGLSAAAAFPGFIGLAFIAFWAAKRGRPTENLER